MWKKQKLKLAPQAKRTLEQAQRGNISPFSLSAQGVKIGVHNWSHGIKEKSNMYLSPENAVKALSAKLVDYADPNRPRGQQDVIAVMITSNDIQDFISRLEQVRVLMPEPTFKQALDYAKASKSLQETKMIKTPTIQSPAFAKSADITPGANREMQSILRNAMSAAKATSSGDPQAKLTALLAVKREKEQQNARRVAEMLDTSVLVDAFSVSDFLESADAQIKLNIPPASNVFTACVMFIGADLSTIKGMLNDND
ncbi:hypothetical protein [Pasteurella multocida]|uniref:hypothetical protein n=1 Tax=Pasteurella multocida TaxID=747 RepID=UPI000998FC39|nr:hypothetical protein [Pasteurella multocida]MBE7394360.1 hypothetical protein [Pasteurella multocida]MCL7771925.1 hypothetical protein [Pasteurella multocida]OPD05366.1 hypothetical protein BTV57_05010 [Pasteurella multocida subsp. septica]